MERNILKNYGVIRMETNKQFLIYCCFCDKKLVQMKEFEQHIFDAHINMSELAPTASQKHNITTKPQIYVIPKQNVKYCDSNDEVKINVGDLIQPELKYLEITTLSPIKSHFTSSTNNLLDNLKIEQEISDLDNFEIAEQNLIKKVTVLKEDIGILENSEILLLENKNEELAMQNFKTLNESSNYKVKMDQKLIKILENELNISSESDEDDILKDISKHENNLQDNNEDIITSDSDDENYLDKFNSENYNTNGKDNKINSISDKTDEVSNDKFLQNDDSDLDDENLKTFLNSLCSDSEEEIFNKVIDNYYCLKCNKIFKKLYNFERHQQLHEVEHTCIECGLKCSTRKQLTLHQRAHSKLGPLVCKICSKHFRTKNTLRNHHKIHFGTKPFKCDWCGDKRKFFYMREKLIHERTMHTKDYQFQCELCGRGFATQSFLKRHKRYAHTTDRNFICKFCNKAFTTHEGVYRHEKIHNSERPFQCEICPSKFVSSSHLKRHIQTHTGVKPFQCELCQKYFSRKVNLNDHLRTIHGKIFNNEQNMLISLT